MTCAFVCTDAATSYLFLTLFFRKTSHFFAKQFFITKQSFNFVKNLGVVISSPPPLILHRYGVTRAFVCTDDPSIIKQLPSANARSEWSPSEEPFEFVHLPFNRSLFAASDWAIELKAHISQKSSM